MKATDIIKTLCYDSALIEKGGADIMEMGECSNLDAYCAGFFGTAKELNGLFCPLKWEGERIIGETYLYMYVEDTEYVYKLFGAPDAFCKRVEGDTVALWRVE